MKMAVTHLRTFTAFRTVEDHPCQQVFSEIFKAVDLTRRRKECVTGAKLNALAFDRKPAATGCDNVEFVSGVRLLHVSTFGGINFDRQGAMAEEFGIEFTVARWNGVLRVGKLDDAFSGEIHFVSPLEGALPFLKP